MSAYVPSQARCQVMITFNVVKEPHGWAIRMDTRMTTPFWSRALAIQEANCLANDICRHGAHAEVVVEDHVALPASERIRTAGSPRRDLSVGRPSSARE